MSPQSDSTPNPIRVTTESKKRIEPVQPPIPVIVFSLPVRARISFYTLVHLFWRGGKFCTHSFIGNPRKKRRR
jgi:hypothetical protein